MRILACLLNYMQQQLDFYIKMKIKFSLQTLRASTKSRRSSTPERTTKRRSSVSFTPRPRPKSPGSRTAFHSPRIRESSVNEEIVTFFFCRELRDPPSGPTLARRLTNLDLMKELLKFQVLVITD
jgi:hypothetical protein